MGGAPATGRLFAFWRFGCDKLAMKTHSVIALLCGLTTLSSPAAASYELRAATLVERVGDITVKIPAARFLNRHFRASMMGLGCWGW